MVLASGDNCSRPKHIFNGGAKHATRAVTSNKIRYRLGIPLEYGYYTSTEGKRNPRELLDGDPPPKAIRRTREKAIYPSMRTNKPLRSRAASAWLIQKL